MRFFFLPNGHAGDEVVCAVYAVYAVGSGRGAVAYLDVYEMIARVVAFVACRAFSMVV